MKKYMLVHAMLWVGCNIGQPTIERFPPEDEVPGFECQTDFKEILESGCNKIACSCEQPITFCEEQTDGQICCSNRGEGHLVDIGQCADGLCIFTTCTDF